MVDEDEKKSCDKPPETIADVAVNEAWAANIKLGYDAALNKLNSILSQSQQELAAINSVTIRALENSQNIIHRSQENAMETANLAGKAALEVAKFGTNKIWNVNETDYIAKEILGAPTTDAIDALTAKFVADVAAATKAAMPQPSTE